MILPGSDQDWLEPDAREGLTDKKEKAQTKIEQREKGEMYNQLVILERV
jgi:hypothetical protein